MQLKIRSMRRLYAGLLVIGIGLVGVYFAANLRFGTASAMGPGFLPTLCSWIIVGLGIIVLSMVFRDDIEVMDAPVPRPVIMIFISVGLFALFIDRAGSVITVFATAFVASYAGPSKFFETIILSAAASAAIAIVFVMLLGLPIDLWPEIG